MFNPDLTLQVNQATRNSPGAHNDSNIKKIKATHNFFEGLKKKKHAERLQKNIACVNLCQESLCESIDYDGWILSKQRKREREKISESEEASNCLNCWEEAGRGSAFNLVSDWRNKQERRTKRI